MSQVNETNSSPCFRTLGYPARTRCHSRQNISQCNTWIEAVETTWKGHRSCALPEEETAVCVPSECTSVLSRAWFCDPMTVALQGPLSLGFPRQEYWSGLPFPPPGDLPDSGMEPSFLCFLHGQVRSLLLSHLGPALPPPGTSGQERQPTFLQFFPKFGRFFGSRVSAHQREGYRKRKGRVWSVSKKDTEQGNRSMLI